MFKEKQMKQSLFCLAGIVATTIALTAFNASAENYTVQGTVIEANPVYQTVTQQIPTQTCNTVDVPVYGNTGSQGSSVFGLDLEGAIIGGVIGNNVTKNVDNGGAVGALLGGMIGADRKKQNQQIVGYRQEQRCSTSYTTQSQQVLSHTAIVVDAGGYMVTANTKRQVAVGDVVEVGVQLTVN